jgi:hypothetical protein
VVATQSLAAFHGGSASQPQVASGLAGAAALLASSGAVLRDTGTGRTPRLKARAMRGGSASAGSASGSGVANRPPPRPVHLRLGGGRSMPGGSASGAWVAKHLPVRPVHLRLGSRDWASRYRGAVMNSGSRRTIPGAAFSRSGGRLGDGAGGKALRPSRGPRLRGPAMPGGSASGSRASVGRPVRPVHLRLGARSARAGRRRDGAIGGSVLGRKPRRATVRGGGTIGRGAFSGGTFSRGASGGGRRGSAAGKTHVPRFRRSKPGTLGGRGMLTSPGGSGLGGSGLGGSRYGSPRGGSLSRRRGRVVFGHRTGRRWFGGKRTGGVR